MYKDKLQAFLFKNKLNEKSLMYFYDEFSENTVKYIVKDLIKLEELKEDFYIYSDGNCLNNGKLNAKGGYSVHFTDDKNNLFYKFNKTKLISSLPTNNKAELSGIKQIFKTINLNKELFKKDKINYIICTDSQYAINCITEWSVKWINNNWKNSKGECIKNKELIEEIINLRDNIPDDIKITFKHVFGHTKEPSNKDSIEWKYWYGNHKVDNNINELFRLTKSI